MIDVGKRVYEIKSTKDLKDERFKEMVRRYNLNMGEILPDYLELLDNAKRNGNRLIFPKKEASLNRYGDCIKRLASGMVIIYELTKSDRIKTNFTIKRKWSIENCETICENLQEYIDFFENRQINKMEEFVKNEN